MATRTRSRTISLPALMPDGSDVEFRQLVHDLLAFSSRLEDVRNRFGSYIGLTGIQYTLLISIHHLAKEKGIGVKEIAEHLSLSGSFVTIETTKLAKLDLLEKRPNEQDRRRILLRVTEKGAALLEQLAPLQCEVNDELFRSLDKQKFEALSQIAADLKVDAERALSLADYLSGRPVRAPRI